MADFNLLEPVSPDMPCGPDLDARDDPAFLDYYFEAESRLPERYFTPGLAPDGHQDRQFDPRSVDLAGETAAIMALLARSRDLRLMSLLARFQILAGRLEAFTATIEDIAAAMAQWPDALHPGGSERRAALESLNAQATVVMPLLHLPVLANTDATLRRYLVVTGKAKPRADEADLAGSDFLGPLRSDANLRALGVTQAQLTRLADALHRILGLARSHGAAPLRPDLGALLGAVADMQAMIAQARPDLPAWQSPPDAPVPAVADPMVTDPLPGATGRAPARSDDAPAAARPVPDRATAAGALDAAIVWLATHEPSSPALVLATQARQLVGKPLVEAIEILMPEKAGAALLRLGQGTAFALPMDRLKSLTQAGLAEPATGLDRTAADWPIAARADLVATLLGIEAYFTAHEPASPVPLLLAKAREMLHKRFDAIVAELLASAALIGET